MKKSILTLAILSALSFASVAQVAQSTPCPAGASSCSGTNQQLGDVNTNYGDTRSSANQIGTSAISNGNTINPSFDNRTQTTQTTTSTISGGNTSSSATGNLSNNDNRSSVGNVGSNSGGNNLATGPSTSSVGDTSATGGAGGAGIAHATGGAGGAGGQGGAGGNAAQQQGIDRSGNSSNRNTNRQTNDSASNSSSNSGGNTLSNGSASTSSSGGNTMIGGSTSNSQSNAGNNTTVTGDTVTYEAQKRAPVATAYASPLSASNGTCMGSSSGGLQGVSLGISLGSTWTDNSCDLRYDAEALRAAGLPRAAQARLCQKAEIAKAMDDAGTPCPKAKQTAAVSAPGAVTSVDSSGAGNAEPATQYQDPIIRARLGLPPLTLSRAGN